MKRNFYKEYHKNQKMINKHYKNEKVVIEKQNILMKLILYIIAFFIFIFKLVIFIGIIALLSIGATVICNNVLHINFSNIIGG